MYKHWNFTKCLVMDIWFKVLEKSWTPIGQHVYEPCVLPTRCRGYIFTLLLLQGESGPSGPYGGHGEDGERVRNKNKSQFSFWPFFILEKQRLVYARVRCFSPLNPAGSQIWTLTSHQSHLSMSFTTQLMYDLFWSRFYLCTPVSASSPSSLHTFPSFPAFSSELLSLP